MRYLLSSLFLAAIVACGCDNGAQNGRFVVNGSSSMSLAGVAGSLTIVQGDSQPLTPQSTGQRPLLYILVIVPSVTASGSDSSSDNGTYMSTYRQSWDSAQGKVVVELSWDRRTDEVSAGGATFDRNRGNVFVLIRDSTGNIAVTQAGPLIAGLDMSIALPQIQAVLPSDSLAKNVTLAR